MSLAQKHKNDVYLQATTANSLVKLVPIFYPRKGFPQVTRALQRCFIWAPPPPPGLPLIVNFDGQRLSPSLEQSLNCVYLCVYCVLCTVCTCVCTVYCVYLWTCVCTVYCVYLWTCVLVNTLLSRAISQLEEKLISSSGNSILPDCLSSRRLQSLWSGAGSKAAIYLWARERNSRESQFI